MGLGLGYIQDDGITPKTIFGSSLFAWYPPDAAYQDDAATSRAVLAGQSVLRHKDRSGNFYLSSKYGVAL